jgi:hypothetical protein
MVYGLWAYKPSYNRGAHCTIAGDGQRTTQPARSLIGARINLRTSPVC